jgi:hypothetical protein
MCAFVRVGLLGAGLLAAGLATGTGVNHAAEPAGGIVAAVGSGQAAEITTRRDEIEQLRGRLPDQSHVMKDVGYHFTNLWFAAQAKNWPLAKFYLDETRSHLRWAVRVIPVRRTGSGRLDLRPILDGLERTVFSDLQQAVDRQDTAGSPRCTAGASSDAIRATRPPRSPISVPASRSSRKFRSSTSIPTPRGRDEGLAIARGLVLGVRAQIRR